MAGPLPVLIGLDVGTTAAKVAAFEVADATGAGRSATAVGAAAAEALREYRLEQPHPGWQVQDPAAILAAIDAALADVVASLDGRRILGVSVSTAMHGLIGLGADSVPLTPLITWADARSAPQARELRAAGRGAELLRLTGTPVHPMSPLVKLRWLGRHEPDLVARARWWIGLKDLVLEHLTGHLVTELSSASATGLFDVHSRAWSPEALALAGISADQLPEVLPTTATLPLAAEVADATGLTAGLPVAVGAADGPLGNLGTGAITPGIAGLSLGTSGAVRMAVNGPVTDDAGRLFCYALTEDLWVLGGAVSNGGITLRWAGETFTPDLLTHGHADTELLALATQVPAGADGLVMLPYVLSERAPLWDPDLTGAFLGVRHHHGRAHFLRAAVEGVCLQVATIVDLLDATAPVRAVRATGGPFRAQLWRQVMAATIGRPFAIASDAGGTALGAAALGWYALDGAADLATALQAVGGPGGEGGVDGGTQVPVSADLVAGYATRRSRLPELIRSLAEVADVFENARP
ncbi:sugar kinase [Occultella glacieicola]|uniref:Sugar kinase n=1 Tax=Occultella glacieicola TaxID=2518684 RepID=A0ABY2DYZ3_9MICO|nr:gluconokinase [Occultella glacieicola]TDE89613.1 sugar kinase [Occultella glacieicola]